MYTYRLENVLHYIPFGHALVYLGVLCFSKAAAIIKYRRNLEIIGTNFLYWKWPATAWGIFDFLPSFNPPSGISFFYFGLDLGCLLLYKKTS